MTRAEPLPNCRRKALIMLGVSTASLLLAAAAYLRHWPVSESLLGIATGFGIGGLLSAVLLWFTPDASDGVPKELMRRYRREFVPAVTAYVAVMLLWKQLLALVQAPWLRLLVALLPALLVLWVMRAFVRFVRDSDEMQRRIELESGAVAALLISAGFMAAGFVQMAGLIEIPAAVAMLWVFPSLCLTYGVAKIFIGGRYL
jgi:hypothetical protein